ncbi:hypothetical protein GQ44DRAFT_64242 [Phaeosphaeriaceae sp. PMI808]|nr:hypothetical protein GQ44DRAFT_64242 [Phaeosphaeriaceae sp. PMI808]
MHFRCTTVLASLLALSQTFWDTQAIPVTSLQPIDNPVLIRDNGISQVDNVQVYQPKRAPVEVDMSTIMYRGEDNLLKTWSGWIDEPENSGWMRIQSLISRS